MKRKPILRLLRLCSLLLLCTGFAACDEWTETEVVENTVKKPWEQDPALWAQYTAALRAYKQSEHYIVYARLYNSPAVATSEKDFMRSLPDSLDIVSLTNADNFSHHDAEDLAVMREKGTRVLYQIDYAARAARLADRAALTAYLDRVVAAVDNYGLDGYSFTGTPRIDDPAAAQQAALIVERLSADPTKLLVLEGNPLFLSAADREKVDYIVLDTEAIDNVLEVKLKVINATDYAGVPAEKLLLAAEVGMPLKDEDRTEWAAVEEMARRVIPNGPLGGLAAYNIGADYYNSDMNYRMVRQAIQTLNPSK